MMRQLLGAASLLAVAACASTSAGAGMDSGPPCRSLEVTEARHAQYVAIFRQIFTTQAGTEMRAQLGVRPVGRGEVQPWLGRESRCLELMTRAIEALNAERGMGLVPGESSFLMVRAADYSILVTQGWVGEITPAVLLKGTSLESHEIFAVAN